MINVKKHGIILKPTAHDFESAAVLNPGVVKEGKHVHILYRAINPLHQSSIGYAKLLGPTKVIERSRQAVMQRQYDYESRGIEDPRIVKIGKTYYVFYVAHDGKSAVTAYATSRDLKTYKKRGIISPKLTYREAARLLAQSKLKDAYFLFSAYYQKESGKDVLLWGKDMFLFPKKIKGRYALVQRILPDIQITMFDRLKQLSSQLFWREKLKHLADDVILENKHWFESRNVGGGCPPVETDEGWLLIFHTVEETNKGRVYRACAALLDKNNPQKVIARLHEPLFSPTKPWEKAGLVEQVVFPTGTALFGSELYIYYGAADQTIAVASINLADLIKEIKNPARSHKDEKF